MAVVFSKWVRCPIMSMISVCPECGNQVSSIYRARMSNGSIGKLVKIVHVGKYLNCTTYIQSLKIKVEMQND